MNQHIRILKAAIRTMVIMALLGTPWVGAVAADLVTVQLKWVHQAQFAGFYLAAQRGYYEDEDLDVSFVEAGPGIDVYDPVVNGTADFAIGAPETLLTMRAGGSPLVAISAIARRNATVFISLPESGIERPRDLLGHSVSAGGVADLELQLQAMVAKLGLDIEQISLVPHTYDLTSFYNGDVDCIAVYSTGGLIRARQVVSGVNVIWPSDYGVHLYGDIIITSDALVVSNPALITRFLRATLRGWRDAVEDPDVAVAATLLYALEADPQLQTEMMLASVPLIHTGEDWIGWMRAETWEGMHEMLLAQGILSEAVDLSSVYTMAFLEQIYEEAAE